MAVNERQLKNIYEDLSKEYDNLGDYESFAETMQNSDKARRSVHNAMTEMYGKDLAGDYDTFMDRMGYRTAYDYVGKPDDATGVAQQPEQAPKANVVSDPWGNTRIVHPQTQPAQAQVQVHEPQQKPHNFVEQASQNAPDFNDVAMGKKQPDYGMQQNGQQDQTLVPLSREESQRTANERREISSKLRTEQELQRAATTKNVVDAMKRTYDYQTQMAQQGNEVSLEKAREEREAESNAQRMREAAANYTYDYVVKPAIDKAIGLGNMNKKLLQVQDAKESAKLLDNAMTDEAAAIYARTAYGMDFGKMSSAQKEGIKKEFEGQMSGQMIEELSRLKAPTNNLDYWMRTARQSMTMNHLQGFITNVLGTDYEQMSRAVEQNAVANYGNEIKDKWYGGVLTGSAQGTAMFLDMMMLDKILRFGPVSWMNKIAGGGLAEYSAAWAPGSRGLAQAVVDGIVKTPWKNSLIRSSASLASQYMVFGRLGAINETLGILNDPDTVNRYGSLNTIGGWLNDMGNDAAKIMNTYHKEGKKGALMTLVGSTTAGIPGIAGKALGFVGEVGFFTAAGAWDAVEEHNSKHPEDQIEIWDYDNWAEDTLTNVGMVGAMKIMGYGQALAGADLRTRSQRMRDYATSTNELMKKIGMEFDRDDFYALERAGLGKMKAFDFDMMQKLMESGNYDRLVKSNELPLTTLFKLRMAMEHRMGVAGYTADDQGNVVATMNPYDLVKQAVWSSGDHGRFNVTAYGMNDEVVMQKSFGTPDEAKKYSLALNYKGADNGRRMMEMMVGDNMHIVKDAIHEWADENGVGRLDAEEVYSDWLAERENAMPLAKEVSEQIRNKIWAKMSENRQAIIAEIREDIRQKTGVDLNGVLQKPANMLTEEERDAFDQYTRALEERKKDDTTDPAVRIVEKTMDPKSGTVKYGTDATGREVTVKEGESDGVILADPNTGETLGMVDKKEVTITNEVPAEQVIEANKAVVAEAERQAGAEIAAEKPAEVADEELPSGALAEEGTPIMYYDENNNLVEGTYIGPDHMQTWKHVIKDKNGNVVSRRLDEDEIVLPEVKAETPAAPENVNGTGTAQVAATETAPANAVGAGMPLNAKGKPDPIGNGVTPERALQYLEQERGMEPDVVKELIDGQVKKAGEDIAKYAKKKPDASKMDSDDYIDAYEQWKKGCMALREVENRWKAIADAITAREEAVKAEQRAREEAMRKQMAAEEQARIDAIREQQLKETQERERAYREFQAELERKRQEQEALEAEQANEELTGDQLAEQAVLEEQKRRERMRIGQRLAEVGQLTDLDQPADEAMAAQVAYLSPDFKVTPESLRLELGSNFGKFGREGMLRLADNNGRTISEIADAITQAAGYDANGQWRLDANTVREELIKCIREGSAEAITALEKRVGIGTQRPEDRPEYWTEEKIAEYEAKQQQNQQMTEVKQQIAAASEEVNTSPTDAQKEAGNYKKGHVKLDGMEISIEQPKGSQRSGVDADGLPWSVRMNNTYGYIRGTKGKDKDHIDIFLSDNPEEGSVFVVDQIDPRTGEFDEHKVMYGFNSLEEAREAYLSNYMSDWQGLGNITEVNKTAFKVWLSESVHKTKPFADYRLVKAEQAKMGLERGYEAGRNPFAQDRTGEFLNGNEGYEPIEGEAPFSKGNEPYTENVTPEQKMATNTLMTALEGAKIPVEVATPEMVEQLAGNEEMMGASNRKKKMANIAQALNGVQMDADQRKVYEAFVNERKGGVITANDSNGSTRKLELSLGNENGIGVLHAIFRHAGATTDYITSEDILAVPDLFRNGNRRPGNRPNRFEYSVTDANGITTTLVTEKHGDRELFANLYTNKTAPNPQLRTQGNNTTANNAQRHAVNGNSAISAANVENNNGNANNNGRNIAVEGQNSANNGVNGSSGEHLFKTREGVVYGWAKDGKIYLTADGINPNTPIHEYSHLWAESVKKNAPKLWENVKSLMKQTDMWEKVLGDELYQDIHGDEDRMVSEVLSRLSGRRGAEKLTEMAKTWMAENPDASIDEKAAHLSIIARMKQAINDVWNWVGKELFGIEQFGSAEEVADRTLYDLMNGTDLKLEEISDSKTEFSIRNKEYDENTVKLTENNYVDAMYGMGMKYLNEIHDELDALRYNVSYDKDGNRVNQYWTKGRVGQFEYTHFGQNDIIGYQKVSKNGEPYDPVYGRDLYKKQWEYLEEPMREYKEFYERMAEKAPQAWMKQDLMSKARAVEVRMERMKQLAEGVEPTNAQFGRWAAEDNGKNSVRYRDYEGENEQLMKASEEHMKAVENGDMETAQKLVYEAAKASGYTIHAYHGTNRADRVGTEFKPERATSGPMSFFTDNKGIADNYAKNKKDTSMAYDGDWDAGDYHTQFKVNVGGYAGEVRMENAWGYLPYELRNEITKKAMQVTTDDMGNIITEEGNTRGTGGYDWNLKQRRGNAIKALVDEWLDSGNLFNKEGQFMEVLEKSGVLEAFEKMGWKDARYLDPNYSEPKTYDTYLKIEKPFDTNEMYTEKFVDRLENWWNRLSKKKQAELTKESMDADHWDKNSKTIEQWVEDARYDLAHGETWAWTVIPDALTEYLKSKGYDGIIDRGGKGGGTGHNVYIPFYPEQIKSTEAVTRDAEGKVIPLSERFDATQKDIRFREGGTDDIAGTDKMGNPIDKDGKLVYEKTTVDNLSEEDFKKPYRTVQLPPVSQGLATALSIEGKPVMLKKNIFEKNLKSHPEIGGAEENREILNAAMYSANKYGAAQPKTRPYYRVAIHTEKNGHSLVVLDVYEGKDNVEIVGWRKLRDKSLEQLENQATREGGQLLILSPENGSAAGLSTLPHDKVSERKGSEEIRNNQISGQEITETAEKMAETLNKKVKICQNADEISDPGVKAAVKKAEAEGRTPTRKGWFNTRTGEIEVYAPAAENVEDVQKTVLHETVGHYGLRELLSDSEQDYNNAMLEMYRLMNDKQKKEVQKMMADRKYDVATAMDEYLAKMAEDRENMVEPGFWQKAKSVVKNLLRKLGIDMELSDGDLKYMLWSSHEALKNSREVVNADGSKSRVYDRKTMDQKAADWAMRWHNDVLGLRSKWEAEHGTKRSDVRDRDSDPDDDPTTPGGGGSPSPTGGREYTIEQKLNMEAMRFDRQLEEIQNETDKKAIGDKLLRFVKERMQPLTGKRMTSMDINGLISKIEHAKNLTRKSAMENALLDIDDTIVHAEVSAEVEDMLNKLNIKTQTSTKKGLVKGVLVDDTANRILEDIKASYQQMINTTADARMSEIRREIRKKMAEYGISRQDDPAMPEELKNAIAPLKQQLTELVEQKKQMQTTQQMETMDQLNEREQFIQAEIGNIAANGGEMSEAYTEELMALPIKKKLAEMRKLKSLIDGVPEGGGDNLNRALEKTSRNSELWTVLMKEKVRAQRNVARLSREINEELSNIVGEGRDRRRAEVQEEIRREIELDRITCNALRMNEVTDQQKQKANETFWTSIKDDLQKMSDLNNAPTFSFNYLLKLVDMNHGLGDGELYAHFMKSERGALKANNNMKMGIREFGQNVDDMAEKIFGKGNRASALESLIADSDKRTGKPIYKLTEKSPDPNAVQQRDDRNMTKGEMLYMWLTWRQEAGKLKMMQAGWTERSISEMEEQMGEEYKQFGTWASDVFLPRLRADKYNQTYRKIYGTDMHAAKHYFPIRIDKTAIMDKSEVGMNEPEGMPVSGASNLIVRTGNTLPVDASVNAIEMLLDYGRKMERWNAMQDLVKDLNTIYRCKAVGNLMEANHKGMYEIFKNAANVATGNFDIDEKNVYDKIFGYLQRGGTGAAIRYGWYTALKQTLSAPAFLSYDDSWRYQAIRLMNQTPLTAYKNYQWAKENLPAFADRIADNDMGIEGLNEKTVLDILTGKVAKYGMMANKVVDACTVANGAYAIYKYDSERYKKMLNDDGTRKYTDEQAEDMAKVNAELAFNESQQSSRNEMSSPVQKSRSIVNKGATAFQNSNIGYRRMALEGYHDWERAGRIRDNRIAQAEKIADETARNKAIEEAKAYYWKMKRRGAMKMATVGILNAWWFMGLNPALTWRMVTMNGDDEDKDKFVKGMLMNVALGYLTNGTMLGPIISTGVTKIMNGDVRNIDLNPFMFLTVMNDAVNDVKNTLKNDDWGELSWALVKNSIRAGGGVDLEKFDNMWDGIYDIWERGDVKRDDIFKILNMPKSQRKEFAQHDTDLPISEYIKNYMSADKRVEPGKRGKAWLGGIGYEKELTDTKLNEIVKMYMNEKVPGFAERKKQLDKITKEARAMYKELTGKDKAPKYYDHLAWDKAMKEVTKDDPETQMAYLRYVNMAPSYTDKKTHEGKYDKLLTDLKNAVKELRDGKEGSQKKVDEAVKKVIELEEKIVKLWPEKKEK